MTAVELGLPYLGWCPKGGWAEDYQTPPGLLLEFPNLRETPSGEPEQRTAWNVRDSDATLILSPVPLLSTSNGTRFTRLCAELIFLKPLQITDLEPDLLGPTVMSWLLDQIKATRRGPFCLNVAGPRESEAPGIHDVARMYLGRLFASVLRSA